MSKPITVYERCAYIVEYLQSEGKDSPRRTIRHMWEAAQQPAGDSSTGEGRGGLADRASLSTYHRTVAKLVRQGQLLEDGVDVEGAALYQIAPQLSAFNTYTLTDLEGVLWENSGPAEMAAYLDGLDYFEARVKTVLPKAAQALLSEDPRALILRMLKDLAEDLAEDVGFLHDRGVDDPGLKPRAEQKLDDLRHFVNSELGISATTWAFPSFEALEQGGEFEAPDWSAVEEAVRRHVFGRSFLQKTAIEPASNSRSAPIVAGSDGSSHAGYIRGIPAQHYVEEEGRLILEFNNSIAYVAIPNTYPGRFEFPFHGVPMTRAAIEDPGNQGMIISRPWYSELTDSEFEHMKKAALDVVQFRVDERLLTGVARALGDPSGGGGAGSLLPKPNVLIRDGTVTPQEREFQHYCNSSRYGDVVREGIALSNNILRAVRESESRVFAGAVKFTQLKTFSRIINWYIQRNIDRNWDARKASHVTDSLAVTRLISALPSLERHEYYRTCVVVRPFSALITDLRSVRHESSEEWLAYFRERQERQLREFERYGGEPPWFAKQDVADDPYVRMCRFADYASFYFGSPSPSPEIGLPRFEFMDSLRSLSDAERAERVERSVGMVMTGVHLTRWTLDREHNFMTQRRMPKLVPFVVYEAHEKCKALGHKLEAELLQAITARLSQLKGLRGLPVPKVEIEPMPTTSFVRGFMKGLTAPDDKGGPS